MQSTAIYCVSGEQLFILFKELEDYNLSYVYKGIFNPNLTDKILSLSETNMNLTGESSKTQKKVYFVMVETLQNITRHQDVNQTEENHAFFVVLNKQGEYSLTSGNIIDNSKIDELTQSIEKINSLQPDELKEYYKHVLENTGMSDKGGAGLGLIEMARKSGNKLLYHFRKLKDNSSFFYFNTKVHNENSTIGENDSPDNIMRIHDFTKQHNINLIYQGVFTHDNLKSLLTMTEGSVSRNEDVAIKKKTVNVMVELLQNICNHAASPNPNALGKHGILIVSSNAYGCCISSGNYVENNEIGALKEKIDRVNALNGDDLENYYAKVIAQDQAPGQKGAGLGFIDIKMKSGNNLDYTIVSCANAYSFLSINAFINF